METCRGKDARHRVSTRKMSLIFRTNNHRNPKNHSPDKKCDQRDLDVDCQPII
jgi:hypothetical protein